MDNIYKFVGKRIRQERMRLGITQEELADRSKITGKFLSNVERGAKKPSLETVNRVSKGLGIPFEDLVNDEVMINPPDDHYAIEIKRILKGLSLSEMKKVVETVKAMIKSARKGNKIKSIKEPFLT